MPYNGGPHFDPRMVAAQQRMMQQQQQMHAYNQHPQQPKYGKDPARFPLTSGVGTAQYSYQNVSSLARVQQTQAASVPRSSTTKGMIIFLSCPG